MRSAKVITLMAGLAGGLAVLATGAAAQNVTEVDVPARAPTQVRIELAGKAPEAVKQEVRVAAGTVCRNAVVNGELDLGDFGWCDRRTEAKALRRYAAIRAGAYDMAAAPSLVLTAR